LVLEQVELALARACELPNVLEPRLYRPGLLIPPRALPQAHRLLGSAQIVEDLQLGGREHELAVLVLSVEGEQPAADVPQDGDGGRAPVQVGARAPIRADAPRQDELVGVGAEQLAE